MKIIAKPRRDGKTTELIKLSAETNTYILVANKMRQKEVVRLADLMNINILYPVTVEDYIRTQFRGSFIKNILIDDAEDILQAFFYTVAIDAITITTARTSCEDTISKTEVINTIHETIYGFFDIADNDSEEPINDKDKLLLTINKALSNAVKALPSVTPSRPKGKWIEHPHECGDNWQYPQYECSKCHIWVEYDDDFCPNCGADMRGEQK